MKRRKLGPKPRIRKKNNNFLRNLLETIITTGNGRDLFTI